MQVVEFGPFDFLETFMNERLLDHLDVSNERAIEDNSTQDGGAILILQTWLV